MNLETIYWSSYTPRWLYKTISYICTVCLAIFQKSRQASMLCYNTCPIRFVLLSTECYGSLFQHLLNMFYAGTWNSLHILFQNLPTSYFFVNQTFFYMIIWRQYFHNRLSMAQNIKFSKILPSRPHFCITVVPPQLTVSSISALTG